MQPEFDIHALRRHWPSEAPAADLAERIVARAIAQPQRQPFALKLRAFLASLNPLQGEAITGRGLAFAACLLAAVVVMEPSMTSRPVNDAGSTKKASLLGTKKDVNRMLEETFWDGYY